MPNRLADETSPYLQQHADNPVDWYPWGPEALERARREDKPILLSIGYAACHWCHVMEHESFENDETARLMNELFVNIKVDREERPDIDAIYMTAVQAMTGHGGWPMTMFLTPEGVPFYGGTYFPPDDRQGMPSFARVMRSVADAYATRRADVERSAEGVRALLQRSSEAVRGAGALTAQLLERSWRQLARSYDARHGGFGDAPKFPQTMALDFSLRYWRRTGTEHALEIARDSFLRMARGGVYDQIGGGFHRYAVDAVWLVPHFEKMLYDNALLARLGVHLWQATGGEEIRRVTRETLDWAAREMTSPEGGFYSSLDADSEGHEGKFYVWDVHELDRLLGEDARIVMQHYGVSPEGNFEGKSILHVPHDPRAVAVRTGMDVERVSEMVARARGVLYEARARRVWPGRDEKVLASWNGLMLRALAEGARVFDHDDYRATALANGEFLFSRMVRDGRVMRARTGGETRIAGFLDDHAAVALGALALYELTFDRVWLARAETVADAMITWFFDATSGAFFDTAGDHEALIARPREITDNATPSGTSLATELLLRLGDLTHNVDMRRRATQLLESMAEPMTRYPLAFGHLLGVADLEINGAVEVALAGEPGEAGFRALEREVARHYLPALVLAGGVPAQDGAIALMEGRSMREGRATAYVCRQYACDEPTTEAALLGRQLETAATLAPER
ncbi:MAG TPA: thioredoxin domain-containing protein [Gemmatimonadaceae bacterium]|nr:thioredoxin domain-containing protein [Gemmatimonadaceae bacterium]